MFIFIKIFAAIYFCNIHITRQPIDRQESTVESIPHFGNVRRTKNPKKTNLNFQGGFTFEAHVKFYASSISAQYLMMDVELTSKAFILLYSAFRELRFVSLLYLFPVVKLAAD